MNFSFIVAAGTGLPAVYGPLTVRKSGVSFIIDWSIGKVRGRRKVERWVRGDERS